MKFVMRARLKTANAPLIPRGATLSPVFMEKWVRMAGNSLLEVEFFIFIFGFPITPTLHYICQGPSIRDKQEEEGGGGKTRRGSTTDTDPSSPPLPPNPPASPTIYRWKITLWKNMTKLHSANKLGMVEKSARRGL